MFYKFAKSVVTVILFLIGGHFRIQNKEKIIEGPFVVVSTHSTWIEILYLGRALTPQQIYFMAKQELFKNKVFSWVLLHLGAFPVNREKPGPSAIKAPIKLLRSGKIVGIFPSGTRNTSNVQLKRGAVTIAYKAGVPMLPAVYEGPKTMKELLKRKKITIRFGDAIDFESKEQEQKEILEEKSQALMETFAKLRAEIKETDIKK